MDDLQLEAYTKKCQEHLAGLEKQLDLKGFYSPPPKPAVEEKKGRSEAKCLPKNIRIIKILHS